jgi:HD domain
MKSRLFLVPVVILGLALLSSFSLPVAAAAPTVKLVLGGSGATSWNIGGTKPGDSGTQIITVLNSGTESGDLIIWVSNIVNTEGTNPKFEPGPSNGDLGSYITFSIVSSRISSNIAMPSLVNSLPQNASDSRYIKVSSLAAGETIIINWNWSLPSGTGNIVQGDSLSFTINYALEELSPPSAPPATSPAPPAPASVPGPSPAAPVSASGPSPQITLVEVQSQGVSLAQFEVRNLTITPVQALTGENIIINYEVINTGGQSGEFTVIINIFGMLQTSRLVTLEAGEVQAMNLTLPPGKPGTYPVDIGGEKASFTIRALSSMLPASIQTQKVMWIWLISIIILVIGEAILVFYLIIFLMRRRRTIHQRRVAELASAIAQEMKLSPKLVKMLLMFGVIRDPDAAEATYPEAKTVVQYNQRLNGSGYPQKLVGDNILLEARIMAVADMAETMSSPKPHRPAISLTKVMEDIKWSNIALYDTEIVKALTSLVNRGNFKFRTHYI